MQDEHQIDDSQKDLVFRIGDISNDAGDEDVGGKYSDGTYGSAITMQIRGNFTDDAGGSGINKFYYKTSTIPNFCVLLNTPLLENFKKNVLQRGNIY